MGGVSLPACTTHWGLKIRGLDIHLQVTFKLVEGIEWSSELKGKREKERGREKKKRTSNDRYIHFTHRLCKIIEKIVYKHFEER